MIRRSLGQKGWKVNELGLLSLPLLATLLMVGIIWFFTNRALSADGLSGPRRILPLLGEKPIADFPGRRRTDAARGPLGGGPNRMLSDSDGIADFLGLTRSAGRDLCLNRHP